MLAPDIDISQLSPAEQAELDSLLIEEEQENERVRCEGSLAEFVKAAWSKFEAVPLKWNWHLDLFCDELERITWQLPRWDRPDQVQKQLIANLPPRSAKSSIVSVCWVAWTWAQQEPERIEEYPLAGAHVQFLYVSYEQGAAEKDAIKCKTLINSEWYQNHWGDHVTLLNDAAWKFNNNRGGYRMCASVHGAVTGHGGAIVVMDDLVGSEQSNSAVALEAANRFMQETLPTRINDPINGAMVLNMQRMNENDPTGYLLEQPEYGNWRHLSLPMRYDPTRRDPRDERTEDGELLDYNRFTEAAARALENKLGPYAWETQYQQLSRPRAGNIILESWWKIWPPAWLCKNGPECSCQAHRHYPNFSYIVGSLDTAYGEKEQNDFNAFTKWGIWWEGGEPGSGGKPRLLMIEAWRAKLPLLGERSREYQSPDERRMARGLTERVMASCDGNGDPNMAVDVLLIENKSRGPDVANEIRKLLDPGQFSVRLVEPKGSKLERLHAVVPLFTDEIIYTPVKTWAQAVINEVLSFPKGKNDDYTDSLTQALGFLRKQGLVFLTGETDPDAPPPDYGGERGGSPYDL